MSRRRLPYGTTAQRLALTGLTNFEIVFDTDLDRYFVWNGTSWIDQVTGLAGSITSTLETGLQHSWELDEASGTRADAVGAATLTDNNTVGSGTGLTSALAADFVRANSEYLEAASLGDVNLFGGGGDFTISLWAKLDDVTSNQWLVSKYNAVGPVNELYFYYRGADDLFRVVSSPDGTNASATSWDIPFVATASAWFNLVITYSATTGWQGLVNNGTPTTSAVVAIGSTAAKLQLGNFAGNYLDGLIQGVQIWDRVLTTDERTELYNSGAGKAYPFSVPGEEAASSGEGDSLLNGLVEFWPLDNTAGVRRGAHSSFDLTDNNTVTFAAGKARPRAAQFVAANDERLSVAVGDIDLFNVFHLSSWVYFDTLTGNQQWLVAKFVTTGDQRELLLYLDPSDNTIRVIKYTDGTSGGGVSVSSGVSPSAGSWYFVEAWHDGTNINISVNNGTPVSAAESSSFSSTSNLIFGGQQAGGTNQTLNGRIADVGIWNRVLTADERTLLYNGGLGYTYPFRFKPTA